MCQTDRRTGSRTKSKLVQKRADYTQDPSGYTFRGAPTSVSTHHLPLWLGLGPGPEGERSDGAARRSGALSSPLRVDYRSACKLPSNHRAKRKPSDILVNKSKLLSAEVTLSQENHRALAHPQHHEGNARLFHADSYREASAWRLQRARLTPPRAQRPRRSSAWGHSPEVPPATSSSARCCHGPLRTPV